MRRFKSGLAAFAAFAALISTSTAQAGVVLKQGFKNVAALMHNPKWAFINNSNPLGTTDWFQGNDTVFPAQKGATDSYIGANFNNTGNHGTISDWMIIPFFHYAPGSTLSFYTRTVDSPVAADRLQIRFASTNSSNVGNTAKSVGDFTNLVDTINPDLTLTDYPSGWTQYTYTASQSFDARFAFRYFVTGAGVRGANSDYIGIDSLRVTITPEPSAVAMLFAFGTVTGGIVLRRRRK